MRFVSWNVNGLRACVNKGFMESFKRLDADFFCIQETKMQPEQLSLQLDGYEQYWNSAQRKGYSGTAIFSKIKPINVYYGINIEKYDQEGRVITLELQDFYLVTVYTPNSKSGLERLPYRMEWEEDFCKYLLKLNEKKPVIVCGDLNVAHNEIDLKNPKTNHKNAGFTDEEREKFGKLLESGFVDTFRYLYPEKASIYSWWSYLRKARERNAGWRIDYFLVSASLRNNIEEAYIYDDILGSDHCPVGLDLKKIS